MGPGGIVKGSYDPKQLSQDQRNWLYGQFGHSGNAPAGYGGEHVEGDAGQNFAVGQSGPSASQTALDMMKQAQAFQLQANQPAIANLQTYKTDLGAAYDDLLAKTMGQGSAALNTATSGENAYLGQRGLLSQGGLGNNLMSQAQQSVQAQNQAALAGVGVQRSTAMQPVVSEISSLQAGNVPNALNFGGNVANVSAGVTNTNTQFQEALQAAQLAAAKPFGVGNLVFNPSTNNFTQPRGGGGEGISDPISLAQMIISQNSRQPASTIANYVRPH